MREYIIQKSAIYGSAHYHSILTQYSERQAPHLIPTKGEVLFHRRHTRFLVASVYSTARQVMSVRMLEECSGLHNRDRKKTPRPKFPASVQ
jgi:hypothetical protein